MEKVVRTCYYILEYIVSLSVAAELESEMIKPINSIPPQSSRPS